MKGSVVIKTNKGTVLTGALAPDTGPQAGLKAGGGKVTPHNKSIQTGVENAVLVHFRGGESVRQAGCVGW